MVLVPPDAAIRMRMQTESNLLEQVQPVRAIPSDLPELQPGQNFSARIQQVLPDNTYRALVAGKQLTLQLPEGAKAGDELELVVLDRSARVVIARQVDAKTITAADTAPYAYAKFSPAARLIGQLLPAEGEAAPPAQLNRGQPLLAQPPAGQNAAALLAPTLAKSVAQSGVFYEAHQAQWVKGKLPLEQLLQEPQGQKSSPTAFQHAAAEIAGRSIDRPVTAQSVLQTPQPGAQKVSADGTAPVAANASSAASVTSQGALLAQRIPDDLRPLVQQQLDAAAANRVFWHGEVWPRQAMDWEIEWDGEREADGRIEDEDHWRTALSLTTPRLGRIDASLQLSAKGVSIALATPLGASASDLRNAAPALVEALAAAGVPLLNFNIRSEDEYPAG